MPYVKLSMTGLALVMGLLFTPLSPSPGMADVREIVKQVLPATVAVEKTVETQKESGSVVNICSGTVLSEDGWIVTLGTGDADSTNSISVTFPDGRALPAKMVVDDRRSGLLLLKVDAADLPHVELSDDEAELGEAVVSVVCMSLKDRAVLRGIISAIDARVSSHLPKMLRTDMMIGPMSAGAPLVDESGKMKGMIAAFSSKSPDSRGPGFAIGVSYVRKLMQFSKGGFEGVVVIRPGFLGITLTSKDDGKPVVAGASEGSPAAKADIRKGDVVLQVDDREMETAADVMRTVGERGEGEMVAIHLRRGDLEIVREVRLAARPQFQQDAPQKYKAIHVVAPRVHILKPQLPPGAPSTPQAADANTLKEYHRALEFLKNSERPDVRTPTLRVERSDTEQRIDRLSEELKSLRVEMEKLTEAVGDLGKEIRELSGDR